MYACICTCSATPCMLVHEALLEIVSCALCQPHFAAPVIELEIFGVWTKCHPGEVCLLILEMLKEAAKAYGSADDSWCLTKLIERNTQIPTEKSQMFTSYEDKDANARTLEMELTYDIDKNDIMNVLLQARQPSCCKTNRITIESNDHLKSQFWHAPTVVIGSEQLVARRNK